MNDKFIESSYKPEIDGLRAIAVLSVILFHAFPEYISGGYVGVDIFFVISGYLITSIIKRDLSNNNFSLKDFYFRRIKRIFPPLIIVLTATLIFGWFSLLPHEFKQLGLHSFGGASFISNFILWNEVNYFDNLAETKPLLHLWSLGIEEQFYLLWPLLLFFLFKKRINYLVETIFILIVISFSFNIYYLSINPENSFYLPHSRFFELLVGAVLTDDYFNQRFKKLIERLSQFKKKEFQKENEKLLSELLGFLGITLIVLSIFYLKPDNQFPGFNVLFPVIGTCLIITSGKNSLISKVLSNKILVNIGLISYSLYLWHWPILSFGTIIQSGDTSRDFKIAAIVLSFILAFISTKYIENPIRQIKNNSVMHTLLLLMFFVGLSGYIIFINEGFSFRKNASLIKYEGDVGHLDFHRYISNNYYPCNPKSIYENALKFTEYTRCNQSKKDNSPEILLLGDSHAEHLFIGLAEELPNKNVGFYIQNSLPIQKSKDFKEIYKEILSNQNIKIIIVSARYSLRFDKETGSQKEFKNSIETLSKTNKEIFITDDLPLFPFLPEQCQGKRWLSTIDSTCEMDYELFKESRDKYIKVIDEIISDYPNIKLIELSKYICDNFKCRMTLNNQILFRDFDHLNILGSRYVGKRIVAEYLSK